MPGMSVPPVSPRTEAVSSPPKQAVISARKEAAPIVKGADLSQTQQTIIREIHEWLTAFLSHEHQPDIPCPGAPVADSFLPSLDDERMNNVLLLDGERGTGKTTLLLTLLQMWKAALQLDDAQGDAQSKVQLSSDPNVTSLLSTRSVVPLAILDLQPLGKQHSLILQLAGRLYRVVSVLDGASQRDWGDGGSETSLPKTRWLDFVRAVAIGHEDDPRKRLASSNPEDFAIELETAERRQMNIGRQWSLLVDSLVDRLPKKSVSGLKDGKDPCAVGKDPCFVIPIDDADMNPERGVELLELLRSLWHPRVVFLLTGDSDLFRSLLFNHYKKVCERLPVEKANHLAADVLGKVIPPGQRWKCVPSEPIGFSFLSRHGLLPEPLQKKVKDGSLESAFPQRWRVLLDLEQTLRAHHLDAVEATRVLFEESLRESYLTSEEQSRLLRSCFSRARNGRGLHVNENVVQMRPVSLDRDSLTIDVVDNAPRRSLSWSVADDDRWSLRKTATGDATQEQPEDLADNLVHALYLAASCASEPRDKDDVAHVRLGRSLSPRDYGLISSQFGFGRISYDFPLPMPDWQDPISFLRFVRAWRALLAMRAGILSSTSRSSGVSEKQQDTLEELAAFWLVALCELGESGTIPQALPTMLASHEARQELWRSLGVRIAELAKSPDSPGTQRGALLDWAQTDAMFFATKESGLRLATRKVLTEGWLEAMCPLIAGEVKDERYWKLVGQVMGGRIQKIQQASASQGSIIDQINQARPQVRAQSLKAIFQSDVTEEKPIPTGLRDVYQLNDPVAIIALLIDGMEPSASGPLEHQEQFSYLFPGQFITSATRSAHFREHVRLRLSNANVCSLPAGLSNRWKSLWSRIGIHFEIVLTNMASQSSLLSDVANLDAKSANREILRRYVQMTTPSLAAGIEAEISRVEALPGRYPTPSVDSRKEFKIHLLAENPDFITLYVPRLVYDFGLSKDYFKDHSPMDTGTALGLLSAFRDIAVDQNDNTITFDVTPLLDPCYLIEFQGTKFIIPAPNWLCHYDNELVGLAFEQLGDAIAKLTTLYQPQVWMAGFFLFSVLMIRGSRNSNFYQHYSAELDSRGQTATSTRWGLDADERLWTALRKLVREFYEPHLSGHRAAAVREWVNLAGPLFAAPETGMPSAAASKWLQMWDGMDNNIDSLEVRRRLSEFRLKRAQASIGSEATMEQAQELLTKADEANLNHAWIRLIERR